MSELVTCEVHDGVANVVMDDGKANVMSLPMLEALHAAFDQAARAAAIAVLSSGRPGIFSAGFDMNPLSRGEVTKSVAMVRAGAELALKLLAFEAPVISVCTGHAYPMGAFLLLSSDLRLGIDADYRIGLNEVTVGIPVPGFAIELARSRLHPAWLSRTVLTGEMFSPHDSVTAGFLDRLVAPADLEASVASAVAALTRVHRASHAVAKRRLRAALIATMCSAIEAEVSVEAFAVSARQAAAAPSSMPG
jgi:enoyl-CoA hydratase